MLPRRSPYTLQRTEGASLFPMRTPSRWLEVRLYTPEGAGRVLSGTTKAPIGSSAEYHQHGSMERRRMGGLGGGEKVADDGYVSRPPFASPGRPVSTTDRLDRHFKRHHLAV